MQCACTCKACNCRVENDMEKPLVLWSVYFNLNMCKVDQQNDAKKLPTNLHLTSDPDYTITHESAIEEVLVVLSSVCTSMPIVIAGKAHIQEIVPR